MDGHRSRRGRRRVTRHGDTRGQGERRRGKRRPPMRPPPVNPTHPPEPERRRTERQPPRAPPAGMQQEGGERRACPDLLGPEERGMLRDQPGYRGRADDPERRRRPPNSGVLHHGNRRRSAGGGLPREARQDHQVHGKDSEQAHEGDGQDRANHHVGRRLHAERRIGGNLAHGGECDRGHCRRHPPMGRAQQRRGTGAEERRAAVSTTRIHRAGRRRARTRVDDERVFPTHWMAVRAPRLPLHRVATGRHRAEDLRGQRLGIIGRGLQRIERHRLLRGVVQRETTEGDGQRLVERNRQRTGRGRQMAVDGWHCAHQTWMRRRRAEREREGKQQKNRGLSGPARTRHGGSPAKVATNRVARILLMIKYSAVTIAVRPWDCVSPSGYGAAATARPAVQAGSDVRRARLPVWV